MSFQEYPNYKDSGVEWLGAVPAHWHLAPIKRLVTLRSGGTPDKTHVAYWDGSIPWASAKDLKSESIADTQDHITQLAINDGAATLVAAGSILVVVRGMILAHTFPVTKALVQMAINQDLKAILPESTLDADYLAWLLRGSSEETIRRLDEAGHGTKALRMEAWTSMLLPLPSLKEQARIASFLGAETAKIDALVREQERLIELLSEKRRATISHAVTKGLDPRCRMKPSGIEWLGEVPEHWDVLRLGRRIELQRGVDITRDQQNPGVIPVVSSGGISSYHDHALVSGPGVIVGRKGTAGSIHYVESDYWPHDTTLYVKEFRGNLPRFVYYKFHSLDLASFDTGSANPTINRNLVHPLLVSWPPISEQLAIANALDDRCAGYDALTGQAERAIQLLKERRTALISAVVTGKIDVRGLLNAEAA